MKTVKQELNEIKYVALTSEGWTARTADHYLTVTVHFINKDWELLCRALQTSKVTVTQSQMNIAAELMKYLEECGLENKVKVITTDNAKSLTNATYDCGREIAIGCFAHTLNVAALK